jgi:hypothetical protein
MCAIAPKLSCLPVPFAIVRTSWELKKLSINPLLMTGKLKHTILSQHTFHLLKVIEHQDDCRAQLSNVEVITIALESVMHFR